MSDAASDGRVMDERERDIRTDELQQGIEVIHADELLGREVLKGLLAAVNK